MAEDVTAEDVMAGSDDLTGAEERPQTLPG
jgi:hypothetical protein